MSIEGLNDRVHHEAQRVLDRRMRRTPCLVTAYRGDIHAVKVSVLPSQTGTNWISIETGQIGEVIAPNIGDPGWLDFHEDDRRAAVFVGSTHNDQHPVPQQIHAGERLIKLKTGQSLYFKLDGSITATDDEGAFVQLLNGTFTVSDKNGTTVSGDGNGIAAVTASVEVNVTSPAINLGNGGTLQPVKLADGSVSTVVKAQ
jgi:hypothetical protein